jgi:hypothetical protein
MWTEQVAATGNASVPDLLSNDTHHCHQVPIRAYGRVVDGPIQKPGRGQPAQVHVCAWDPRCAVTS